MVYTALRDAADIETKFMQICPQWSLAMETHLFWQQAVALIDPLDNMGQFAFARMNPNSAQVPQTLRLTPYRHFRNITMCSCFVCRINLPATNQGLAHAKRTQHTPYLGTVPVCRDHNRKGAFCGLCLREADAQQDTLIVCCLENEDEESWPGVDATCRSCRSEWLWRRVCNSARDRDAIGDLSSIARIGKRAKLLTGTITDVITLAQEKYWLRQYTKLPELLSQALAASRYVGYENEAADDDLTLSELEAEEEEDADLMQMTEESGGVRELAIADWARNRILDGFWWSPADQYYGNFVPNRPRVVRAVHPCPWALDESEVQRDGTEDHPRQAIVTADIPPSYALCEQAYNAFQRQQRNILFPAMKNIVRKLVIECGADGIDPSVKAARMTPEDVLAELRDEAVWYDETEKRAKRPGRGEITETEGGGKRRLFVLNEERGVSHNKPSSLHFNSADNTFPPPVDQKDDSNMSIHSRRVTIAVAPVLDPPRLLTSIPYIPITISNLPQYSLEAFKAVWRRRVRLCIIADVESANALKQGERRGCCSNSPTHSASPAPSNTAPQKPLEIRLEAAIDLDGGRISEDGEAEAEEKRRKMTAPMLPKMDLPLKPLPNSHQPARHHLYGRGSDQMSPEEGFLQFLVSPGRLRKRGSEELDDAEDDNEVKGNGTKRTKVSVDPTADHESPPSSLTASLLAYSDGDYESSPDDCSDISL
ncbi:abc domain-containing protein [Salix suchowensis]|nr:abc domain-containing protein [Salix suchowensis]